MPTEQNGKSQEQVKAQQAETDLSREMRLMLEQGKQIAPYWPPDFLSNDPSIAIEQIKLIRRDFHPEWGINGKWYKSARERALAIRQQWLDYRSSTAAGLRYLNIELQLVPPANNPSWPVENDFINLEQWFVNATIARAKYEDHIKFNDIPAASKGQAATKEPSRKAIQCYRLHIAGHSQTSIAEMMKLHQGSVSKWLKQVRAYVEAGNILPALPPTGSKSRSYTADPRKLDYQEKPDGKVRPRKSRQQYDAED